MTKPTLFTVAFLGIALMPIFAQKIVLHFNTAPVTLPVVSKASLRYNKDFAYSFTMDDCTVDHYTFAKPLFRGGVVANTGYTSPGLFFTDGCGNDVAFKAGIAWNSTNTGGYGANANDPSKMSWGQLQELYSYGWDVLNHGYAHRAWGEIAGSYTYANEIRQNNENVRNRLGFDMSCFVVPSGDYNFQDIALQQGQKAVFDQNFPQGNVNYNGIVVEEQANWGNLKAYREDITTQIATARKLTNAANQSINGKHIWYNEFAHHLDILNEAPFNFYKFRDYMLNIANTYGKNGSDRVWFAPLQEVYEYMISRQNTSYTVAMTPDNKCEIMLNSSAVPNWLRRKTLTLVINSTANFSNITLPQGVTATWRGTGSTKLINLDFTNYSPLIPVELMSFSAEAKGTTALLNWETASEHQFHGFEVERSFDGINYTQIGKVEGNNHASKYTFEDKNRYKTSYYRLKMLDNDGFFDYSKIVSLLVPSKFKVKITPSVSDDVVLIETDFEDKTDATVQIFNQTGKLMSQKKVTDSDRIPMSHFPEGIYFVRVNYRTDFWVRKVAKF